MLSRTEFHRARALLPEMPAIGYSRQSAALPGNLRAHSHDDAFEIVLITKGSVEWWVNEDRFRLHTGNLFLTRPYENHGSVNESLEPSEIYWIQLRFPCGDRPFGLCEKERIRVLQRLQTCQRTGRFSPGITRHFDKVLFEYAAQASSETLIRAHALAILDFALDDLRQQTHELDTKHRIEKAQSWALAHLSEKLRISDWARQVGLSETRFYEVFKREAGLSPNDWLNRQRIRVGAQMLVSTRQSITDVAFSTGFSSTQYFSTCFKKFVGSTPRAYRKQELERSRR